MGETIYLTGDYGYDGYRANGVEFATIDASNATWIVANVGSDVNRYPVRVYDGNDVSLVGGTINGEVPLDTDWGATYVNSAAIFVRDSDNALIQDWTITRAWDGIRIRGDSENTFTIDGVYMSGIRDDAIENDSGLSGTVKNSLFDGVFVGLSTSDANTVADDNVVTLDNVLMRMESYEFRGEKTHLSPFKVTDASPLMRIHDTVIAIEDVDHAGLGRLEVAWEKTIESSGNYFLNLSDDPLPSDYPMPPSGFTVLQGAEARAFWGAQRDAWLADHGDENDEVSSAAFDENDGTDQSDATEQENAADAEATANKDGGAAVEAPAGNEQQPNLVEPENGAATTEEDSAFSPKDAVEGSSELAPEKVDTGTEPTAAPQNAQQELVTAINIGSNKSYTAGDGTVFAADTTGVGRFYTKSGAIAETDDDRLYQTEAWGPNGLLYGFDVEDGQYKVTLHFAEIWKGTQYDNGRVFDVALEGATIYDDLDLYEVAGARTAYVLESVVEVEDGELNLDLVAGIQNPKLSALEIHRVDEVPESQSGVSDDEVGTTFEIFEPPSNAYENSEKPSHSERDDADAASVSGETQLQEELVTAINIGSAKAHTAVDGTVFDADTTGIGRYYAKGGAIAETDDDRLYQTEAWGPDGLSYGFDVDDGQYKVTLHFAEIWKGTQYDNGRVFDVALEGATIYEDLDLYEVAGARTAYVLESAVEVEDGELNIDLVAGIQNPKLSALEIHRIEELQVDASVDAGEGDPGYLQGTEPVFQDLMLTPDGESRGEVDADVEDVPEQSIWEII